MSAPDIWDLIVIGAGPAGSTAARAGAQAGARVLLLDKAQFPRYKTCGGGLIGHSLANLTPKVLETVETNPKVAIFSRMGKQSLVREEDRPFVAMVQRDVFDQALVNEAVAAGTLFLPSTRVSAIHQNDELVTVIAEGASFQTRIAIGADGCGGKVGRYVGASIERTDLGLEVEVPIPTGDAAWAETVYLDWGKAEGSYGWVFPKAGHLTVGVIQRRGNATETRQYLETWLDYLSLNGIAPLRSSGHLTQWRTSLSPVRRGRVIIAGETAGLLEPWTREGISFALRSGRLAGAIAASAASLTDPVEVHSRLATYDESIDAQLMPEINAGRKLLHIFENHGGLIDLAVSRSDRASRFFVRYCRGDKTFESIPPRLLSIVHRVFGQ